MRLSPLFLLSLLIAVPAEAQRLELRGTVVDSASGAPAPGALVEAKRSRAHAFVGSDGAFTLAMREGDTLVVTRLGYDTLRVGIHASGTLRLALVPNAVQLARLEVLGGEGGHNHATICPIVRVASLLHGSALDILQDWTGLRRVTCIAAPANAYCAPLRGTIQPIQAYVDGVALAGGAGALAEVPAHHLHAMHVLDEGRVAWVITRSHAEQVAAGAVPPAVPPP